MPLKELSNDAVEADVADCNKNANTSLFLRELDIS